MPKAAINGFMDYLSVVLLLSFLWACTHVLKSTLLGRNPGCTTTLPPGPRPLPIFGNIFDIGDEPHRALANLSKTYGPIMTLKLGRTRTVVISSPSIVKEAFQKHDQTLSSRQIPDVARAYNHHMNSMVWLPASAHWKNLRKVSATHLFTSQRLEATQSLRRKKVQQLLDYVHENCIKGQAIDIGRAAFTTMLNLLSNTFFSVDLAAYNSTSSQEFGELVLSLMQLSGRPNVVDYFPILRLVDPQGARRRATMYLAKLVGIFDEIIKERRQLRASLKTSETRDVLDSLLNLVEDDNSELSFVDVQQLLLDFFVAGTDTISTTIEWAMTELLLNPEKMTKVKSELKEDKELIEESDVSRFDYLHAVVKETYRFHPPGAFLLPRKAETDVEIHGFKIPKNTQIIFNLWAMKQDPSIWANPDSFIPERFLGSEIDVKGRDFDLIPFGAGRRICPGLPLAYRMVPFMLASLIHSFDWMLEDGAEPSSMDVSESFGLSLHKSVPLRAIPIKV